MCLLTHIQFYRLYLPLSTKSLMQNIVIGVVVLICNLHSEMNMEKNNGNMYTIF